MFLALVVGTVVSPVQHPVLDGRRLLLVRPVHPDGTRTGKTRVAIDHVEAGPGELVLVSDEGNAARQMLAAPEGPVKTVVVGVVDQLWWSGAGAAPRASLPQD